MPALAVDGNLATHWTGLNGASLTLDLGSVTQVNDIRIAWKSGNKRRADHDIEVSEDGDAWTLVYSGLSTGKMLIPESHILDQDYFVRYVRITGHGNDAADPASRNKNLITEVEVWGYTWW